jgi:predicted GIY-YIG superfamily endonuclease
MTALLVDVDQLADMHVVYRMLDTQGRLLYVGMTGNLGRRLCDHAEKAWFLGVATITLERFPTAAEAALAEDEAISTEHPLFNHVGLSEEEAGRRKRVRRLQLSTESIRAAEEKRRQATAEKQRIAGEKQHAAEERERLTREQPPRDLLADLDAVLGEERVRLSGLPHLLRQLAPWHIAYEELNGVRLAHELKTAGVRWTKSGGVPRIDPADLRRALNRVN